MKTFNLLIPVIAASLFWSCSWELECSYGESRCKSNIAQNCDEDYYWDEQDCGSEGLKCTMIDDEATCETEARIYEYPAICKPVNFFEIKPVQVYRPFNEFDTTYSYEGFGVYYPYYYANDETGGMVTQEEDEFIFVYHEVYKWMSFRYQFSDGPVSCAGCTGIEFDIRVDDASGCDFRVTVSDAFRYQDAITHGNDGMWWSGTYDLLRTSSEEWAHISIPFEDFWGAYGVGSRSSPDSVLHSAYIVGAEFNVLGTSSDLCSGQFRVKNLKCI